jgi:ATP:cob(I)alamin adenosyltransferase
MPIYTRTGDAGLTGLLGGARVPKQAAQVEAYGAVDEADAAIGVARAVCPDETIRQALAVIQRRLSRLAAELASDGSVTVDDQVDAADVAELEALIDAAMARAEARPGFVVPGDDPVSAALHQARTVVRRAERRVLAAAQEHEVRPEVVTYLNRLSDTLFALALDQAHVQQMSHVERLVRQAVLAKVGAPAGDGFDAPALNLSVARTMAAAAQRRACDLQLPVVFAVVDAGGNLILAQRMDDALLASVELAIDKAFTAAALRCPTAALRDQAGPDGPLFGLESSHHGRIVVVGGGLPVFVRGRLAGGIGVSGGTVEQDEDIVASALRAAQAGQGQEARA